MHTARPLIQAPRLAAVFALAGLAYVWATFFAQNARTWLVNEDYQYGWAAPALFAYFLYRAWRRRPAPDPARPGLPIALAVAGAAALGLAATRLVVEANPDWRPLLWVLAAETVGFSLAIAYLYGGWGYIRHFAFVILFPLSAVPWLGRVEIPITLSFMKVGAAVATEILNACGIVTVQHGTVLETGNGFIGVDEACSGIKSFQTMVLLGLALSEFSGQRGWRRFRTVALGWAIAFLGNLARITFLAWMGARHGTGALEGWHDVAGTTAFAVSGILLVFFGLRTDPRGPLPAGTPVVPVGVGPFPTLALGVCTAVFLTAEIFTFAWYRQGETALRTSWGVAWSRAGASVQPVELSKRIYDMLQCDAGSGETWLTEDGHRWVGYFFEWKPGARAFFARNQHSPEICLPASGRKMIADYGHREIAVGGTRLSVKHLRFDDEGKPLNVFFIADGGSIKSSDEALAATSVSGRLRSVLRHANRADRRSLEFIASGYDDPAEAWERAQELLQSVVATPALAGAAAAPGALAVRAETGAAQR